MYSSVAHERQIVSPSPNPKGQVLQISMLSQVAQVSPQAKQVLEPLSMRKPSLHRHSPFVRSELGPQISHWAKLPHLRQLSPHFKHESPSMNSPAEHCRHFVSPRLNSSGQVLHLSALSQVAHVPPQVLQILNTGSMKNLSWHSHSPIAPTIAFSTQRSHVSTLEHCKHPSPQSLQVSPSIV